MYYVLFHIVFSNFTYIKKIEKLNYLNVLFYYIRTTKTKEPTTSQEIIRSPTMPRGYLTSKKAGTQLDQRLTAAHKICNTNRLCPHGNGITATQKGSVVTMTCGCGQVATFVIDGACATHFDALAHFDDVHE